MDNRGPNLEAILQLEAWQEDLLTQLDDLDNRVKEVLKECQATRRPTDSGGK